jgi:hypothetical protein
MRLALAFLAAAAGAFLIHAGISGKPVKQLLTGGLPTGTVGSGKTTKIITTKDKGTLSGNPTNSAYGAA